MPGALADVLCASLPIADLVAVQLKSRYTLIIVTHNMEQAARVSDRTAFFATELDSTNERRTGTLVEHDATAKIVASPSGA
jgi:phosphate transport system ATP-binding protein